MGEGTSKSGESRRSFMGIATLAMGGLISAVMAVPLFRYLFHPVGKTTVTGSGSSIDAVGLDELDVGADPVKVTLVASGVRDAWNRADEVRLGAAWVQRTGEDSVTAFTTACPHLGCAVDYDSKDKVFKCPCHRSAFGLDGARIEGPSKRGLDPLPVELADGRVKITHKRFVTEIADRVEKA